MAKPALILVGADKGGVGKTTVARTLLDYFTAHHVPTRAFDTETPKGTLKRFYRDVSEVVDATAVADQMRIIDTLSTTDATVTVVDVRAGLMSPTARFARHRLSRRGQKGTDHLCGVPHPRLVDRFAE
jgi:MinD-like ATPase involved in chromosome partitioning or flagellar assembly